MDASGEIIKVDLGSRVQKVGHVKIEIPYQEMKNFEKQYLKCKYYDFDA